jgi:CelD/BcsL family acetyltransferase involved in cellulose biosynthesis
MFGQPGCFADPAFASFLKEASLALRQAGQMCFAWLTIDGRPAGIELLLKQGDRLFDYNGGIEPELLASEPGRLLKIGILQHMLAHGLRSYDLLRGDEPYKAHSRAEPRPTIDIRIVPRTTLAQWRHSVWTAGVQMKDWLKGTLGMSSQ